VKNVLTLSGFVKVQREFAGKDGKSGKVSVREYFLPVSFPLFPYSKFLI
jgi:hypothetical protein